MARCPKTAAEAFKRLDKRLSNEDKKGLVEAENLIDYHFGLGSWIRNYWIYTGEKENLVSLLKDLGEKVPEFDDDDSNEINAPIIFMQPDDISMLIIEAYQKHLRGKRN